MAHYQIIFNDKEHGMQINHFETFEEAQEFWDDFAEVETCNSGVMIDLDDGETIWKFNEGEKR